MITTRIQIESYLAEYVRGKYYDETVGTVRFPSSSDIYVTVYDLMEKRPVNCPADRGNLEFMLPDRREANFAGGKSPEQFNTDAAVSYTGRAARTHGRKQAPARNRV